MNTSKKIQAVQQNGSTKAEQFKFPVGFLMNSEWQIWKLRHGFNVRHYPFLPSHLPKLNEMRAKWTKLVYSCRNNVPRVQIAQALTVFCVTGLCTSGKCYNDSRYDYKKPLQIRNKSNFLVRMTLQSIYDHTAFIAKMSLAEQAFNL